MVDVMEGGWWEEWALQFAEQWGYLGIGLISFVANAIMFVTVPSFLVVFAFGAVLNPWLVGLAGRIGAGFGGG